ncbi:MAG: hypothetical protein R8F63_00075 [Acidimicrobiales bacterium]|nr:hypothetical protein [Acidimicrobiales bacterium]
MVDMVRKVHKAARKSPALLEASETVLAASAVGYVGQFQTTLAAANAGAAGLIHARRTADRAVVASTGTLAAGWPPVKSGILAVTDRRLVLYTQSLRTFGPKELVGAWDRADVHAIGVEPGKASEIVSVQFVDGSVAQMESIVTAKPALLATAFSAGC